MLAIAKAPTVHGPESSSKNLEPSGSSRMWPGCEAIRHHDPAHELGVLFEGVLLIRAIILAALIVGSSRLSTARWVW